VVPRSSRWRFDVVAKLFFGLYYGWIFGPWILNYIIDESAVQIAGIFGFFAACFWCIVRRGAWCGSWHYLVKFEARKKYIRIKE